MEHCFVLDTPCTDPYENLAVEKRLMETLAPDTAILMLWQNHHSIIIGRNQNPFAECRVEDFLADGGRIVRRSSGGGAVYHDLGNLNYTLIVPPEAFDADGQMDMAAFALELVGVKGVKRSGRNDLLADGRKCSGTAFQITKRAGCQHGSILINTDMTVLPRFLTADKSKLQKHGVKSVEARVVNLKELNPKLTVPAVKEALKEAFVRKYGPWKAMPPLAPEETASLREWFAGREWIYPPEIPSPVVKEARFPWGSLRLCLQLENGRITDAAIYTDALGTELFPRIAKVLKGMEADKASGELPEHFPTACENETEILKDVSSLLGGLA